MRGLVVAILIVWLVVTLCPRGTEGFDPFFNAYSCSDNWLWTRTQACRGQTTGPPPVIDLAAYTGR